jgi:inorganic pyrophosphatase
MGLTDRGRPDSKVLCVRDGDPSWSNARGLSAVPAHLRGQFTDFCSVYRRAEGTQGAVKLRGWRDAAAARRLIEAGYRRYGQRASRSASNPQR